jgi:hypothetical protein
MNSNFGLYFYGLFAKLIAFIGVCVLIFGVFMIPFSNFGYLGILIGLVLVLFGKAQRFDYQRQSGSIIHKGDW